MTQNALLIGNSDGIGFAVTKKLLAQNWNISGISRSPSSIKNPGYQHSVADVADPKYTQILSSAIQNIGTVDLCIYFVGIGELLDYNRMHAEVGIFEVNLLALIRTIAEVIPIMRNQSSGHFIGISSVTDDMLSPEAPSYHASKAGFSNYLESLGLALKDTPVNVTNIRFGFVDTKMAKGDDVKPFMISADRAADHILYCIEKKPIRYTTPKIIIPMVKFRKWMLNRKL